jgi:hypothetical protein
MGDISKLSDAELLALERAMKGPQQAPRSIQELSDEELMALKEGHEKSFSGNIVPMTRGPGGNISIDMGAGIPGAIQTMGKEIWEKVKAGAPVAGDVYAGRADPASQETFERTMGMAELATPGGAAARIGRPLGTGLVDDALGGALNWVKPVERRLTRGHAKAPTTDAIKKAASAQYDELDTLGVQYQARDLKRVVDSLKIKLRGFKNKAPAAWKALGDLDRRLTSEIGKVIPKPEYGFMKPKIAPRAKDVPTNLSDLKVDLDAFTGGSGLPSSAAEREAMRRARKDLHNFIFDPPEGAVLAGDAAKAGALLKEANENWAAASRGEQSGQMIRQARYDAAAANSGRNVGARTRRLAEPVMVKPKIKGAGWAQDELDAIEKVIEGSPLRNTLRTTSNLLGGGGGLGSGVAGGLGGGYALSKGMDPSTALMVGAGTMGTGTVLKKAENVLTKRAMKEVDEMLRRRSPLYAKSYKGAPATEKAFQSRLSVVRAALAEKSIKEKPLRMAEMAFQDWI